MTVVLLWLASASAQEEVCRPYSADQLQGDLALSAEALAAFEHGAARLRLEDVQEQLRCLTEPVARDDLAHFARMRTLAYFYDQDTEPMKEWGRLALDLAPDAEWDLVVDHPLRAWLAELPPAEAVTGPTDKGVAHPRKGGVFLDGAFLDVPMARPSTRHLVQIFDDQKRLVDAWWQQGAEFDDRVLADDTSRRRAPDWEELDRVDTRGWKPGRKDTAEAYAEWIRSNPEGPLTEEARRRLDRKRWEHALETDTERAYRDYLQLHPRGDFAADARVSIEEIEFARAEAEGTRTGWESFLGRNRRGLYAVEARIRLDELVYADAVERNTEDAYEGYLARFPRGIQGEAARTRLEALHWARATRLGTAEAFEAHLARWPEGPHADEIRGRLDSLTFDGVALEVSDDPVAGTLAAALTEALEKAHFTVHRGDPAEGEAVAGVAITRAEGRAGTVEVAARITVRVTGLPQPIIAYDVRKVSFPDDPEVGAVLGEYLVRNLPDLAPYKRTPVPDPDAVDPVVREGTEDGTPPEEAP